MPDPTDTPPVESPVAFRRWLIAVQGHPPEWADEIMEPRDVVREYPNIARSVGGLANLRHRNRGPAFIAGPHIAYRRSEIERYLASRTVSPDKPPPKLRKVG